ncbi:STAS domain-containing protein [Streptomyces sp. NPDC101160]|uniref:STAS domain-containing protein n=1 Tax=Streptomyces sp. NPDC101160 TaxID=3366118 RepID=UPI0038057C6E
MTTQPERVAMVFEPERRRIVARVSGEVDLHDAVHVRDHLTEALVASPGGLDIDLAAVTGCDNAGLQVLLDLNRLALQAGKSVVLTALSRPVARLLRVSGAQRLLTVRGWPASDVQGFRMRTSHYGQTAHLAASGALDMDARSAFDEVEAGLDGFDVVACDMRDLSFLDVAGLHTLLDLALRLHARGIAFFTYNWQPQPRRLLDLVDELYPPDDTRGRPTRLQDFAAAARTAGALDDGTRAPHHTHAAVRSQTTAEPQATEPGRSISSTVPHLSS